MEMSGSPNSIPKDHHSIGKVDVKNEQGHEMDSAKLRFQPRRLKIDSQGMSGSVDYFGGN